MNENIYCNACGRKLEVEQGILREDALIVKKNWGYFSRKDLEMHEFVLCEDCYDRLAAGFKKPVSVCLKNEVLDG
jgi:ribosomal-protein-alanine N-acetyltransferase